MDYMEKGYFFFVRFSEKRLASDSFFGCTHYVLRDYVRDYVGALLCA